MENESTAVQEIELNRLRLRCGDTVQVQFVESPDRFGARLIGYLDNRSIIVTAPVQNRRLVPVRTGQQMNVRMMVNDRACAFITTVMHTYRLPYPHMHLEYPRDLVTNKFRKAVRVETRVEGQVINTTIGERGKDIECFLMDISETGVHLVTPIRIGKSGDEILLTLQLKIAGMLRVLKLPAILRGRLKGKSDSEERQVHYGVEFLPLPDDDRIDLIAFVYSKLSSQG